MCIEAVVTEHIAARSIKIFDDLRAYVSKLIQYSRQCSD